MDKEKEILNNYKIAREFILNFIEEVKNKEEHHDIAHVLTMIVADFINKVMCDLKPVLSALQNSGIDGGTLMLCIARSMNVMSNDLQAMCMKNNEVN
jgi:homospermidine synthase